MYTKSKTRFKDLNVDSGTETCYYSQANRLRRPMSQYEEYRESRTSWGINVLGSFCVEIEASDGTKGFATGFGGPPAYWLVHEHFQRFLIGAGV